MIKSILILFFAVFICPSAFSAGRGFDKKPAGDTSVYYLKNAGKLVNNVDSADYVLFIFPADPANKKAAYPFAEYYKNGKRKRTGITLEKHNLKPDGPVMSFYPNGRRASIITFEKGRNTGDEVNYYPNGQVYTVKRRGAKPGQIQLVECHDSTGVATAENGNGKWLVFDDTFSNLLQEGPVKDGVEDGTWTQLIDGQKLGFVYTKGNITKTIDYSLLGEIVAKPEVPATLKGDIKNFYKFLGTKTMYPAVDRENNNTGEVIVSFIVDIDGKVSDFRFIKSVSKTIDAELVRVIKSSEPWVPAKTNSQPVRSKITIPIKFEMTTNLMTGETGGAIIIDHVY